MFDFFYTENYEDKPTAEEDSAVSRHLLESDTGFDHTSNPNSLAKTWRRAWTNLHVYIVSDKYLAKGLKSFSLQNLETMLEAEWNFLGFIELVQEIYQVLGQPPDDLMRPVLKFGATHFARLEIYSKFNVILSNNSSFSQKLEELRETARYAPHLPLKWNQKPPSLGRVTADIGHRVNNLNNEEPKSLQYPRSCYCRPNKTFEDRMAYLLHQVDKHSWCIICGRFVSGYEASHRNIHQKRKRR